MKKTTLIAVLGVIMTSPLYAQEVIYSANIAALFKKSCSECHGADAPNYAQFKAKEDFYKKEKIGPRMNSYEEVLHYIAWPQTGAMMRRLDDGTNTPDKKPGNMYRHLGETDAERSANLKLMKSWIGEDAWFLNRLNKRGDVPGVSLEQLQKVKAKH